MQSGTRIFSRPRRYRFESSRHRTKAAVWESNNDFVSKARFCGSTLTCEGARTILDEVGGFGKRTRGWRVLDRGEKKIRSNATPGLRHQMGMVRDPSFRELLRQRGPEKKEAPRIRGWRGRWWKMQGVWEPKIT